VPSSGQRLADRTAEALEAINEAVAIAERLEHGWCSAGLHRLRGVFLAATGADEAQIEASFCAAISIAKEQKSASLEKRAEETYAEYRRQKSERLRRAWIPTTSLTAGISRHSVRRTRRTQTYKPADRYKTVFASLSGGALPL
jgi:hypothetical protein